MFWAWKNSHFTNFKSPSAQEHLKKFLGPLRKFPLEIKQMQGLIAQFARAIIATTVRRCWTPQDDFVVWSHLKKT